MGRRFLRIRWTSKAAAHALAKHQVTEEELDETVDAGVVMVIAGFGRLAALGTTRAGQPITIVVEEREGELWMVTARKMAPLEEVIFVAEEGYDDEE